MSKAWNAIKWLLYLGLPGICAGFLLKIFAPQMIVWLYIGVACMLPIGLCILVSDKVPTYLLPVIYMVASVAIVWFLYVAGDSLLPEETYYTTRGGRSSGSYISRTHEATGSYLAAWTGLALFVFGAIGAWVMIGDALAAYRKKCNPAPPEATKQSRLPG